MPSQRSQTDVDNPDGWPCFLFHRFIVLLVIHDPAIIIFNSLVRIPAFVLEKRKE
jgi:hypothetical protein